jgi:hypothetical protein
MPGLYFAAAGTALGSRLAPRHQSPATIFLSQVCREVWSAATSSTKEVPVARRVSTRTGIEQVHDLVGIASGPLPAMRGRRFWPRPLLTRIWAGLRRFSFDAALARGADPCESPTLAHRAARLTSERSREKMAACVEELLATARRPPRPPSVAVEPDRSEIAAAALLLIEVRELLRSAAPVYARGVAMLNSLLGDGGSPLYLPARPGDLSHELEMIIAALEGREQPTRSSADWDGPEG